MKGVEGEVLALTVVSRVVNDLNQGPMECNTLSVATRYQSELLIIRILTDITLKTISGSKKTICQWMGFIY